MSDIDSIRIFHNESIDSWTKERLDEILGEIDNRVNGANCWCTITRTLGLISQMDYYSDAAKTKLVCRIQISRTPGTDAVNYITGVVRIFYNTDGSEDSRITVTITRTNNLITSCASVFTTTEPQPPC